MDIDVDDTDLQGANNQLHDCRTEYVHPVIIVSTLLNEPL